MRVNIRRGVATDLAVSISCNLHQDIDQATDGVECRGTGWRGHIHLPLKGLIGRLSRRCSIFSTGDSDLYASNLSLQVLDDLLSLRRLA